MGSSDRYHPKRRSWRPQRRRPLLSLTGTALPGRARLEDIAWVVRVAKQPATCEACQEPILIGHTEYRGTPSHVAQFYRHLCRWCGPKYPAEAKAGAGGEPAAGV